MELTAERPRLISWKASGLHPVVWHGSNSFNRETVCTETRVSACNATTPTRGVESDRIPLHDAFLCKWNDYVSTTIRETINIFVAAIRRMRANNAPLSCCAHHFAAFPRSTFPIIYFPIFLLSMDRRPRVESGSRSRESRLITDTSRRSSWKCNSSSCIMCSKDSPGVEMWVA